jgi:hypothetical protein
MTVACQTECNMLMNTAIVASDNNIAKIFAHKVPVVP